MCYHILKIQRWDSSVSVYKPTDSKKDVIVLKISLFLTLHKRRGKILNSPFYEGRGYENLSFIDS